MASCPGEAKLLEVLRTFHEWSFFLDGPWTIQGFFRGVHGFSWDFHGLSWIFMELSWSFHGIFMEFSWFRWVCGGFSWTSHGIFMELSVVVMDFHGNFKEMSWNFYGFSWIRCALWWMKGGWTVSRAAFYGECIAFGVLITREVRNPSQGTPCCGWIHSMNKLGFVCPGFPLD